MGHWAIPVLPTMTTATMTLMTVHCATAGFPTLKTGHCLMAAIQTLPVDRLAKLGLLMLDHFATPGFPTLVAYRVASLAVHCATASFPTLAVGCVAVVFLTLIAHYLATVRFPMLVTDHCPSVAQKVENDSMTRLLSHPASRTQVSNP